ncbi:AfsR/SARP family transcriptional regulator [Planktotalea sp.]|uniref:AfsR/SARP family transcriptional regulator n=1 Tax=Planktotalea sp. TaxID=2029877 RepID=UPI003D6A3950
MSADKNLRDAAFFADLSDSKGIATALSSLDGESVVLKVSDSPAFLDALYPEAPISFSQAALNSDLLDSQSIVDALGVLLGGHSGNAVLIVDMAWCFNALDAENALETWGGVVEQLVESGSCSVISVYNHTHLLETQMQVALRGHRQFLAPSGVYENPFWLPTRLRLSAGADEQLAFLLGRVVPDHAGLQILDPDDRGYARGSSPMWLDNSHKIDLADRTADRWQIRCLGRLRVYQSGRLVEWTTPGGAAHKTRALFCYLLLSGESGAQADRIGELIWPDQADETRKRARLHHAIAMLRKALGDKSSVLREGEYYRLNAPQGSWTDISAFEQGCRRGLALAKQDDPTGALRIYRAAERQYQGDLFEDLPIEYTHNDLEDWCRPRRRWLCQMALKLLRDMSTVLRSEGLADEALEKCHKALSIDMANESTNMETMRVLHLQGRFEAIDRQYEQFLAASDQRQADLQNTAFYKLYKRLAS